MSNSYLSLLFKTTVYIQAIFLGITFHTKSEEQQLKQDLDPAVQEEVQAPAASTHLLPMQSTMHQLQQTQETQN